MRDINNAIGKCRACNKLVTYGDTIKKNVIRYPDCYDDSDKNIRDKNIRGALVHACDPKDLTGDYKPVRIFGRNYTGIVTEY